MFDAIAVLIAAGGFYLIGRMHGLDAAKATESKLEEMSVQELIDLRKWKADHIGKENP